MGFFYLVHLALFLYAMCSSWQGNGPVGENHFSCGAFLFIGCSHQLFSVLFLFRVPPPRGAIVILAALLPFAFSQREKRVLSSSIFYWLVFVFWGVPGAE